jgi:WhiB family redox-sensing transcriptional regulator
MREPRNYEAPLCAEIGGDTWFPETGGDNITVRTAKRVCNQCTHRTECAEWGIHNERFGIWGGLTELDRRLIRRRLNIIVREEDIA